MRRQQHATDKNLTNETMGTLKVSELEVDRIAKKYGLKLDNETAAEAEYHALTDEIAKARVLEASYVQEQSDRTEK